ADPVNPDPPRIRTIVEKLLPSNIQCQVPANFSALLEASELACSVIACATTAPALNAMPVARARPIRLLLHNEHVFSVSIMIRVSRLSPSKIPSAAALPRGTWKHSDAKCKSVFAYERRFPRRAAA